MKDATVDLVFADPPFNLNKAYGPGIDDAMSDVEYADWCGHGSKSARGSSSLHPRYLARRQAAWPRSTAWPRSITNSRVTTVPSGVSHLNVHASLGA